MTVSEPQLVVVTMAVVFSLHGAHWSVVINVIVVWL